MSEIDTSAAAIEAIQSLVSHYCEPYPSDDRVPMLIGDCKTLLAALAERDAKLSAHDARLTQVLEEMPRVELVRAELNTPFWHNGIAMMPVTLFNSLFEAIESLQRTEAAWRNARDVWDADQRRLQERVEFLEQLSGLRASVISQKDEQLSASNAEICNRVAREAKERCALLEEALRWALDHRAGTNYAGGLRDGGCGCCAEEINPPAHLEPIFRDILGAKT